VGIQRLTIEAFVHDPATLEYFFVEMDRASGIPSLPQMVMEGIEVPGPTDMSVRLKRRAAALLASAKGKAIPRILEQADPALCARYTDAFAALFTRGTPEEVIRLAEELLKEAGGALFEGYRADAPSEWRRDPNTTI
jgi:hypothetical protein